jgi:diaminopimelate epimerase
MTAPPIPFIKGHGTGNDFVILPDPAAAGPVSARLVAALCDRRRGIGADGVLVVERTAAHPEVSHLADVAEFFMDYRNADGSRAQMCGNGARVFVAHLIEAGLVRPGPFTIATRGGPRAVSATKSGLVQVDMGPAEFLERGDIGVHAQDGADPAAALPGAPGATGPVRGVPGATGPVPGAPGATGPVRGVPAVGVLMPNPHAVTWVADVAEAGSLTRAPVVSPPEAFPEGVNVEFVQVLAPDRIRMRVFERGVGETLSCGTGACAAAVATIRRDGGQPRGQRVAVEVPGGEVEVVWSDDGHVRLTGPAVLVARGTIDPRWWSEHV